MTTYHHPDAYTYLRSFFEKLWQVTVIAIFGLYLISFISFVVFSVHHLGPPTVSPEKNTWAWLMTIFPLFSLGVLGLVSHRKGETLEAFVIPGLVYRDGYLAHTVLGFMHGGWSMFIVDLILTVGRNSSADLGPFDAYGALWTIETNGSYALPLVFGALAAVEHVYQRARERQELRPLVALGGFVIGTVLAFLALVVCMAVVFSNLKARGYGTPALFFGLLAVIAVLAAIFGVAGARTAVDPRLKWYRAIPIALRLCGRMVRRIGWLFAVTGDGIATFLDFVHTLVIGVLFLVVAAFFFGATGFLAYLGYHVLLRVNPGFSLMTMWNGPNWWVLVIAGLFALGLFCEIATTLWGFLATFVNMLRPWRAPSLGREDTAGGSAHMATWDEAASALNSGRRNKPRPSGRVEE